jgi:branched-subunit amino acid transport protein
MEQVGLIVAAAVVTYATRVAGFHLADRTLPPMLERFLAYVPVAVFATLIVPGLELGGSTGGARVAGVVAAALAVWRTGHLWAGLLVGMVVFWLLQFVAG